MPNFVTFISLGLHQNSVDTFTYLDTSIIKGSRRLSLFLSIDSWQHYCSFSIEILSVLFFQLTESVQVLIPQHYFCFLRTEIMFYLLHKSLSIFLPCLCSCRWWQLLWMPWVNKLHVGEKWRFKTHTCISVIPIGSSACCLCLNRCWVWWMLTQCWLSCLWKVLLYLTCAWHFHSEHLINRGNELTVHVGCISNVYCQLKTLYIQRVRVYPTCTGLQLKEYSFNWRPAISVTVRSQGISM